MIFNIREIALDLLLKIEANDGYSDELVNSYQEKIKDIRDFNLLRKIVYGVLERYYSLDFFYEQLIDKKKLKDKKINMLIKISLYQIFYLDRISSYAVTDEAVKICKKIDYRKSSFVNAILRNAVRRKKDLIEIFEKKADFVSKYNLNQEVIDYLKSSYGSRFKDLMESFYDEAGVTIRVNGNYSFEEIIKNFEKNDYKLSDISKNTIILSSPEKIHEMEIFKKGIISIQGEGSQLAVEALLDVKNMKVLDLCASPGTKSCYIAEKIENGFLYSNDINKKKNKFLIENFERINFTNYKITNYDATEQVQDFVGKFDKVLVDAPCSALGLIRRKPEIRLRRNLKVIDELSIIQKKIIDNAIKYLKKGGELVYSTCTYGNLENDNNSLYIINKGLTPEKFDFKKGSVDKIQLFSDRDKTDGFFISKFINL